jgi:O-antigen/teichoic acid export membrane protein
MNGSAHSETMTVARNVSTRYLAIAVEMVVGLVVLPYNIAHLGKSAYGLWILTASITSYFSVLDLGYSGALVKFVAQYRAKHDTRSLNEVLSTTFFLFAGLGAIGYGVVLLLSANLQRFFHLSPDQIATGRIVLLVTSLNVVIGMAFGVFGAVINGFQRYDLNNIAGAASSIVSAIANVAALALGGGLISVVVATTTVRLLTYLVYRANAYHVFPALSIRLRFFTRARVRELTGFSVYMSAIDWANKINYSVDALVIGAYLNTTAVAVWSVGQRLAEATQRLTNQLNDVLFPNVVDHDASQRREQLRAMFLVATRLSLATVIPIGGVLMLMAEPLVFAWVGPGFAASVLIVQLLSLTVIIRVGNAMAGTLLKGAGRHRLVACTNVLAAIANLTLSIALVKPMGLAGVAIGTLIPVTLVSLFVIFPAACRRVEVTVAHALRDAVWPAVWPAAPMAAYVVVTRPFIGGSLPAVGADMIGATLVYAAVFVAFGLTAAERQFFTSRLSTLLTRAGVLTPRMTEGA